MCEKPKELKNALVDASEKYGSLVPLRAAIQAIPFVGGPLDMLLSGEGAKTQTKRIMSFLDELSERLGNIESVVALDEESFYDLMLQVFDSVIRTRSEEKRNRFAQLVTNQISNSESWEDAEMAAHLLRDLSDVHIAVLDVAVNAPVCRDTFENLRVVTTSKFTYGTTLLTTQAALSRFSSEAIRMACSELVSRGLLADEGVGRLDTGAMEFLVVTDLGIWFLDWLS